ncbi:Transcriptional regulator BlaI [Symmachiella dynata]|uniref:Transcriptional regulator BlaI n=1 Tax=Symmachiella dynata TaxID=2527995 RepID=A0A517ZVK5_9PLAN|nr:BlaI/MecI/CopY family transcriptional regulator [Symmachiella dynata]QDU46495.1 Transcriptional regulator BlaI [Symmachiella dynata]
MARAQLPYPTPKELEVLQVLWEEEPCSVRQMMEQLGRRRPRAYSSVLNLLNTMTDKGLLMRKAHGSAYLYKARIDRERTNGGLVKDLLNRAFSGSAASLITHALKQGKPTAEELDAITRAIKDYRGGHGVR